MWAIDSNEMSLHLRSGMNAANQSGTGWKRIELKCKKIDRIRVNSSIKSIRSDEKIPINNNGSPAADKVIENFIEDSFYDSIYEANAGDDLSKTENELMNVKPLNNFDESNLNGLMIKNEFSVILENFDNLAIDNFIDKFKTVETNSIGTVSASLLSSQSWDSSNSLEKGGSFIQEDEKNLYEEENIIETDLVVIGFKICTANSFQLDQNRVPNWLSSADFIQDKKINEHTVELRNVILSSLKLRNLREHCHVDKITFPYENVFEKMFFHGS